MSATPIRSPCVGVCSTGLGDSVCRGCKRFAQEVIDWNRYSEAERAAVMARLESLLQQVVEPRFKVLDRGVLAQAAVRAGRNRKLGDSDAALLYETLKAFGGELDDLGQIGVGCRGARMTPAAAKAYLEHHYYQLSCAHFARYFAES